MDEETTCNLGITGTFNLNNQDPQSNSNLTDLVHLLPCSIKLDGPSQISHYFKPRNVVDQLEVKEAYFRGRKLQGSTVPIPQGYRGYVLKNKKKLMKRKRKGDSLDENFAQWESRAEFGNIMYWNHDNLLSSDDPLLRCFHWFHVADALHKPNTAEELASIPTILKEDPN